MMRCLYNVGRRTMAASNPSRSLAGVQRCSPSVVGCGANAGSAFRSAAQTAFRLSSPNCRGANTGCFDGSLEVFRCAFPALYATSRSCSTMAASEEDGDWASEEDNEEDSEEDSEEDGDGVHVFQEDGDGVHVFQEEIWMEKSNSYTVEVILGVKLNSAGVSPLLYLEVDYDDTYNIKLDEELVTDLDYFKRTNILVISGRTGGQSGEENGDQSEEGENGGEPEENLILLKLEKTFTGEPNLPVSVTFKKRLRKKKHPALRITCRYDEDSVCELNISVENEKRKRLKWGSHRRQHVTGTNENRKNQWWPAESDWVRVFLNIQGV